MRLLQASDIFSASNSRNLKSLLLCGISDRVFGRQCWGLRGRAGWGSRKGTREDWELELSRALARCELTQLKQVNRTEEASSSTRKPPAQAHKVRIEAIRLPV